MSSNPRRGAPQLEVFKLYGRFYGSWRPRQYLFPIDEEELNRLDLFHKFFLVARENALFTPQLNTKKPLRILDLGTGTGIWSFNVAEESESQPDIMIVDLHKIQPALIPPGVRTIQFDIEDPSWDPLMRDCDLVHMRTLFGSIHHRLWPDIYRRIFDHLKPESGYVEHVEIDWVPKWEPASNIPENSVLRKWAELFLSGMAAMGRNARINSITVQRTIEAAGFTDVQEQTIQCYVNPWMEDRQKRDVARWFNLGLSHGLEAMSLMPMIEGLHMEEDAVRSLCAQVKTEICHLRYHAYFNIHVWSARRP